MTRYSPGGVEFETLTLIVVDWNVMFGDSVTFSLANETVNPELGVPIAKLTSPVKFSDPVTFRVRVPEPPGSRGSRFDCRLRSKSGPSRLTFT